MVKNPELMFGEVSNLMFRGRTFCSPQSVGGTLCYVSEEEATHSAAKEYNFTPKTNAFLPRHFPFVTIEGNNVAL